MSSQVAQRLPTTQMLLRTALQRFAGRLAARDERRQLTYAELADRAARLARVALEAGASPEAPVAIWLPNRLEFVEADAACTLAGITRVGIGDRLSTDECRYILDHSGARLLITDAERADRLRDGPAPAAELLLVNEGTTSSYEQAIAGASTSGGFPDCGHDSINYLLYTSGTTGRPKGAAHSHGSRAAGVLNMLTDELVLRRDSVMVHVAPVTHGSGSKILPFLAVGAANVLLSRFDVPNMARTVAEHGGTHTFMVPTMLQRLVDARPDDLRALRSLEQISFGGAPISPAAFGAALRALGPVLTQIYGTSEAPHPITVLRPADYGNADTAPDRLLTSAGRATLMTDLRVVDDDGHVLAPGEAGELQVRNAGMMRGYWRDQAATDAVMGDDGWYSSGDVVRLDHDGLVTFQDRKRDLIISGGLNVYPSEVERVLADHPEVKDVAVVGYPDPDWGESVAAYVVPRHPEALTEDQAIAWVRERLAGYKKPRRVIFLDGFPLGSTNKVLKRELRDRLWHSTERRVN
jgi:acyl-CoA synthetase (AMP-forming)/AMP-acid ligase II